MHELFIAKKIIEKAKEHGNVMKVTIELGDIAPLTAQELTNAIEELVDWEIEIEKKPAKVRCQCGYEGEPKIKERKHDFVLFICPKCKEIPKPLEGEDIILKEVEIEE